MLLVMLVTCVSCRQELCYNHFPAMDVRFDWEQEWERDYGMNHHPSWNSERNHFEYDELRPDVPEWIKMVKYFEEGTIEERLFHPEGARFEVPENEECSMLFYNGDTEYIIFSDIASSNDVRATATTRTRAGGSLQAMREMYQTSRTTNSPDVIYSAYFEKSNGVGLHEVKYLPVKMQPLVYTYLIIFEFEKGIEHVALARGALGGMAEGVYLRTGVTTDETSIILFDCDTYSTGCYSRVRSFGIPGFPDSYYGRTDSEIHGQFSLNLEVRLKNGELMEFDYDITDQMKNQPRGGIIRVSGIEIKDNGITTGTASGFEVDVTDWGEGADEIEIELGPFHDVTR